jgi:hypothetical protein
MATNVQYPRFQMPTTASGTSPQASGIINNAIPNFSNLTQNASGIVGNLMGGMPSTAPTRRKAAYFGVGSGMPNSGVSNALGYDLYGQEAAANKQQGFDNFLKLIQGFSGTVSPTTGEQMQQSQFDQDLAFREREADAARELARERLNQPQAGASRMGRSGTYRISGQAGGGMGTSALPVAPFSRW